MNANQSNIPEVLQRIDHSAATDPQVRQAARRHKVWWMVAGSAALIAAVALAVGAVVDDQPVTAVEIPTDTLGGMPVAEVLSECSDTTSGTTKELLIFADGSRMFDTPLLAARSRVGEDAELREVVDPRSQMTYVAVMRGDDSIATLIEVSDANGGWEVSGVFDC